MGQEDAAHEGREWERSRRYTEDPDEDDYRPRHDEDDNGLVDQRIAHRDLLAADRIDFVANLSPRQQWAYAYLDAYFEEIEDTFSQKVLRRWLAISPSVGPVTRNRAEQLVEILRAPPMSEVERTVEPAKGGGLFRRRRQRHGAEDPSEGGGLFG